MTDSIPRRRADRTQLQQIILGLTEGVIIVHADRTIAWANEAALAMHGAAAVPELGADVEEYRKRFELRYRNQRSLPASEYPMERALAGEAFSELVVEVRRPGEERHRVHDIRSLVLRDAEGRPDCIVLVVEDETERFSAEDRFERAFNANPAPAVIARLSDLRYVKVNQGFLEMTGHKRAEVVGRSMHEFDVLEGAEKRELAVERLRAGATIPQMEACLRLPADGERTVIVAGQPIEIGDEACMLFTFADLHPRKQAEHALRQSEERFAVAFRMAPGPMAIIALEGLRLLDVNDAFTSATGWRREEVIGRTESELELWGEADARAELTRLVEQTGRLRSMDVRLRTKDGRSGEYLLSAETVAIHGHHCVLAVMLDISERKQTEAALLAAIEAVMQDTSWFGQKIVEKLANLRSDGRQAPGPDIGDFTPRVREVLGLMAQGLSDEEIGVRLGVARNTVRNHVSAIYRTLGMHHRSAVVVWARERGLGTHEKLGSGRRRGRPS